MYNKEIIVSYITVYVIISPDVNQITLGQTSGSHWIFRSEIYPWVRRRGTDDPEGAYSYRSESWILQQFPVFYIDCPVLASQKMQAMVMNAHT